MFKVIKVMEDPQANHKHRRDLILTDLDKIWTIGKLRATNQFAITIYTLYTLHSTLRNKITDLLLLHQLHPYGTIL